MESTSDKVVEFFRDLDRDFIGLDRVEDETFVYKATDVLLQSVLEIPIVIQWPQSTVRYEFTSLHGDTTFGIVFIAAPEEDREIAEEDIETIEDPERVPSDLESITGSFVPPSEGVIIFVWDNSHDWLSVKKVSYNIVVEQPSFTLIDRVRTETALPQLRDAVEQLDLDLNRQADASDCLTNNNANVTFLEDLIANLRVKLDKRTEEFQSLTQESIVLQERIQLHRQARSGLCIRQLEKPLMLHVLSYLSLDASAPFQFVCQYWNELYQTLLAAQRDKQPSPWATRPVYKMDRKDVDRLLFEIRLRQRFQQQSARSSNTAVSSNDHSSEQHASAASKAHRGRRREANKGELDPEVQQDSDTSSARRRYQRSKSAPAIRTAAVRSRSTPRPTSNSLLQGEQSQGVLHSRVIVSIPSSSSTSGQSSTASSPRNQLRVESGSAPRSPPRPIQPASRPTPRTPLETVEVPANLPADSLATAGQPVFRKSQTQQSYELHYDELLPSQFSSGRVHQQKSSSPRVRHNSAEREREGRDGHVDTSRQQQSPVAVQHKTSSSTKRSQSADPRRQVSWPQDEVGQHDSRKLRSSGRDRSAHHNNSSSSQPPEGRTISGRLSSYLQSQGEEMVDHRLHPSAQHQSVPFEQLARNNKHSHGTPIPQSKQHQQVLKYPTSSMHAETLSRHQKQTEKILAYLSSGWDKVEALKKERRRRQRLIDAWYASFERTHHRPATGQDRRGQLREWQEELQQLSLAIRVRGDKLETLRERMGVPRDMLDAYRARRTGQVGAEDFSFDT